jgi:arylsulfatase
MGVRGKAFQTAVGGILGLIVFLLGSCRQETASRPTILLISVDTLRADHLGCYGYRRATSPHLDQLAREARLYHRAYSPAPWTAPAMAALLSGQYPSSLGVQSPDSVLAQDHEMLAEILAAAGIETAAIVSNAFCGSERHFDQGFAEFDESNLAYTEDISSPV